MNVDRYLARVETAAAVATEGPWRCGGLDVHGAYFVLADGDFDVAENAIEEDATFIALSRDAVPCMAAALRAVLAYAAELDGSDSLDDQLGGVRLKVVLTTALEAF